jgi:hypothetical protein
MTQRITERRECTRPASTVTGEQCEQRTRCIAFPTVSDDLDVRILVRVGARTDRHAVPDIGASARQADCQYRPTIGSNQVTGPIADVRQGAVMLAVSQQMTRDQGACRDNHSGRRAFSEDRGRCSKSVRCLPSALRLCIAVRNRGGRDYPLAQSATVGRPT